MIYHESYETWGFILPLPLLWPIALYSNFDWFDFICIFFVNFKSGFGYNVYNTSVAVVFPVNSVIFPFENNIQYVLT